jgi:hypothetical protein
MRLRFFAAYLLWATYSAAQSGIYPPLAGMIKDNNGILRPVFGTTGNFVVGNGIASGVVSVAFDGNHGLAKMPTSLLIIGSNGLPVCELPAPQGVALLALGANLGRDLVYYPETSELVYLRGCDASPEILPKPGVGGEILSLALTGEGSARVIFNLDGGCWLAEISLFTGVVIQQSYLGELESPVLLGQNGALAFMREGDLVVRTRNAIERHYKIGAPVNKINQIGTDWLTLELATQDNEPGVRFALRLVAEGDERLYRLPEVHP